MAILDQGGRNADRHKERGGETVREGGGEGRLSDTDVPCAAQVPP